MLRTARLPNQPYALPVNLDSLVQHLRIEGTAEERTYISDLAKAAAQVWETRVRQAVMRANYVSVLTSWYGQVHDLMGPIGAVTKVEYTNGEAVLSELLSTDYTLSVLYPDTLLFPAYQSLPRLYGQASEPVRIYYTAGAATVDEVPPIVQQFIRLMVGHYYENPQAVVVAASVVELPLGAQALVDMEREPVL